MNIIKRENRFKGFFELDELEIKLPNDVVISREVLIKRNAVAVVPITSDGMIYLTKQPRAGRGVIDSIEIPAGLIDDGETAEEAAKRELLEETGCVSKNLIELTSFYSDPASCTSEIHVFLATDCQQIAEQKLDSDEYLTVFSVSIDEAYSFLDNGEIKDANSIIGLLKSKDIILKK